MSESQVDQASWYMVLDGVLPIDNEPEVDIDKPELDTPALGNDELMFIIPSTHVSYNEPESEPDTLVADLVDTEIEELECEEVAIRTMFALLGTVVASTVNPFIGIGITAALIILISIIDRSLIDIATCWVLGFTTSTALNTEIGILIFTEPAVALALVILSCHLWLCNYQLE